MTITRGARQALQQLAHQALGRLGVAAALHQNLQDETVLIHGAPQPVLLATDRNDGLIEMPLVAEPTGSAAADLVGESTSEFLRPKPDRLMRDDDPTGSQQVLDHSQAERETEIKPHGVGNDFSRKAMAAIKCIRVCHGLSWHIELQIPLS